MKENPRPGFLYWSDEGDLMAIRYGNWKVHFMEQRAEGADAWQEPFTPLRFPKLVNLRTDPFEEADISGDLGYRKWRADRIFALAPAGALVAAVHADPDGVPAAAESGELEPFGHDGEAQGEREALKKAVRQNGVK